MKLELIKVLDDSGKLLHPEREPKLTPQEHAHLYRTFLLTRLLDDRMLRLQRQGRIGFYLTATGEEATILGAAQGLEPGDWIYTCYREIAAALLRGYSLRTLICQLFGNAEDPVKGRQMPAHHTVRALNFVSVGSSVATQVPHAVGTAWAAKLQGKRDVAVAFVGEGGTSTGIFHSSAVFAGRFRIPAILLVRNNGWAISTPRSVQTVTPTFAQKGIAYGMRHVLVDGNDVLAMIHAVRAAAAHARDGGGPTLLEARTYRRGAHTSSDDPSVYRDPDEPREWETRDPVARYRGYLFERGLMDEAGENLMKQEIADQIAEALREAEAVAPQPPLHTMFEDVFSEMPQHLREQHAELEAQHERHTR